MSTCCDCGTTEKSPDASPKYRRILWIALAINFAMFVAESMSGWHAGSASLLADSLDFFGDATNYGVSLFVLSMALTWRARAALIKGLSMGVFGVYVLGQATWNVMSGASPEAMTMGVIGIAALVANVTVAAMLYAHRKGDSNRRSVWVCSRNDAIGNIAVVLAALGVSYTGSAWPDVIVAVIMGCLALSGAYSVVIQAREEIRSTHTVGRAA